MSPGTVGTIGFVGTGVMGAAMAGHLLDAGYALRVHNRTRAKTDSLVQRGATWCQTAGEAASGADAIITMVGFPSDVEAAYLAAGGIIECAGPDALLVDMTTSSPALAVRIAGQAAERGLMVLDAPVSGGDIGAKSATLTIMAGGESAAFERARPLFAALGRTITLHGGPGAGQHCKMANQIAIAASMFGLAECLTYAKAVGLEPARVIETLSGGSAQSWTLQNYGPRVLSGDFTPGFFVKHFVKDLRIALDEAQSAGLTLPGLELAERLYSTLLESGGSELGTQALCLLYADAEERELLGIDASVAGL
ncbi:MAG: NAD(P)-dependent oxidoreductase [Coriobacteriia bacterium]|nr:NAD(P)-dependent oxidoreductase [Coriobacteriia bacterium]